MRTNLPLKKNSSIEIRLPDQTKAVFMERCQREGRTASDVLRSLIDREMGPSRDAHKRSRSTWRIALAGLVGTAFGLGVAAPSIASSGDQTRPAFERLDRDGDGALTYDEFRSN